MPEMCDICRTKASDASSSWRRRIGAGKSRASLICVFRFSFTAVKLLPIRSASAYDGKAAWTSSSEGGVEKSVDAEVGKAGGVAHLLAHLVEVDGAERADRRGGHPPITEDLPARRD